MKSKPPFLQDDPSPIPGPYDGAVAEELWFLPDEEEAPAMADAPLPRAPQRALVEAAEWRAAEAALAPDLADLCFDAGRLAERLAGFGAGAVQRLALEEAASLSWWTGERVTTDALALWQSYRIGAAGEGGEGLIRTAWAARHLAAGAGAGGLAQRIAAGLGGEGRVDPGLLADVAAALDGLAGLAEVTRASALFHLWRGLEERPDHLRGLEAAVLAARLALRPGGALPFLPLTLTGFTALTVTGSAERRLAGWLSGAHRAVLAALMSLERLATWRARALAETADLQGRTPARLITALTAHPMLGAAEAEEETGASRAAVQRNLDLLVTRGLAREVTGQGRFRVWAARL